MLYLHKRPQRGGSDRGDHEMSDDKEKRMRVVSIINQKGGVGKTTTAVYLAYALAAAGKKVLALDLDASRNMSIEMRQGEEPEYTCIDAFSGDCDTEDAIYNIGKNLDIMCGSKDLAAAPWTKRFQDGDMTVVRDELEQIADNYDFAVVDTPPTLGVLMTNALGASDDIVIPAETDMASVLGISDLKTYIENVKDSVNPGLRIAGILVTRASMNTVMTRTGLEMLEQAAEALGTKVFNTKIHESTYVKEARYSSEFLRSYKKNCKATEDYDSFVAEYLKDLRRLMKGGNQ